MDYQDREIIKVCDDLLELIPQVQKRRQQMGDEIKCETGGGKNPPRAVINLSYSDEVVLIKNNNKFTLRIDNDGHLVGTQEKEIRM